MTRLQAYVIYVILQKTLQGEKWGRFGIRRVSHFLSSGQGRSLTTRHVRLGELAPSFQAWKRVDFGLIYAPILGYSSCLLFSYDQGPGMPSGNQSGLLENPTFSSMIVPPIKLQFWSFPATFEDTRGIPRVYPLISRSCPSIIPFISHSSFLLITPY